MSLDPQKKQEITVLSELIDRMSYYELLKLNASANPREIKTAFLSQSQEYHPDRYFNVGDDQIKAAVTTIYKRIAEAYQTLRNPDRRAAYDKQLKEDPSKTRFEVVSEKKPPSGSAQATAKNPQSRKYLQLAMNCIKKKDFSGAEMNLQFAIRYEPNNETLKKKLEEVQQLREEAQAEKDPYKIQ